MDLTSQIWQIALALSFIVALVLVLGFVAKRLQTYRGVQGGAMQIVDSTVVGSKEKLILVQVENKRVLLGMNPQCITKLLELDDQAASFSEVLKEVSEEQVA